MPIRTHYDNLHVSPDADVQTIRQAYRRLSKQYHPDLNTDPDAHRIMQLINQAYEVLSDPQKRAEHDQWIAAQKTAQQNAQQATIQIVPTHIRYPAQTAPQTASAPIINKKSQRATFWILFGLLIALGLLGWQIFVLAQSKFIPKIAAQNQSASEPAAISTPAVSVSSASELGNTGYVRPFAAPNGNPWPQESGYINGYPVVYGREKNELYIDNVRNSSDVYAELTLSGQTTPLRHFFIKERSYMILDRLDAGAYTIRYRQLDAGEELLSEHVTIGGKAKEATIYLQRGQAPQN